MVGNMGRVLAQLVNTEPFHIQMLTRSTADAAGLGLGLLALQGAHDYTCSADRSLQRPQGASVMAYLVRRPGGGFQIRESVRTERGPRSVMLASFHNDLNDQVLDRADRKAARPLDREDLIAKARALGVGWSSSSNSAARELAKQLRLGRTLDPVLVGLLRGSLSDMPETQLPDDLDEATDWVGATDEERATALQGLLRLGDAIVRSREPLPSRNEEPYPQIDSVQRGAG